VARWIGPVRRALVSNLWSSRVGRSWLLTIRCSLTSLHRYYDPKEDMAAYGGADAGGGKKFAPNAPDGVNLVHSWNKVSLARRKMIRLDRTCSRRVFCHCCR